MSARTVPAVGFEASLWTRKPGSRSRTDFDLSERDCQRRVVLLFDVIHDKVQASSFRRAVELDFHTKTQ